MGWLAKDRLLESRTQISPAMTRNHQDRFILQSTAEVMNSAVRHIDSIVNWMVGDGSLSYGGMTVPGPVNELRRCKSELAEALQKSAFFLADEWNYIENNRARLAEVDRFMEMYGFFRDRVIAYDDARMDNEEKAWKLLDDYMQPQEYVVLVGHFDREFEFQRNHLEVEVRNADVRRPLRGLAVKRSHQFCTGLSDEDFENLIAHRQLPMMQGMWFGEKHYATYFGKRCGPNVAGRPDRAD